MRPVKALFFSYFSLVGAMSPYLGLYYAAWGLSIGQISLLLAVPQLMRVLAPPFWGAWADRVRQQGPLLRLSAAGALVSIGLMALAQGSYPALLMAVGLLSFFTAAQGPIAESMALAAAGGDSGAYGRMRQWGSIGFILAVTLSGPWLDWLGARWLTVPLLLLAALVMLVSWRVSGGGTPGQTGGASPGQASRSAMPAGRRQSIWRRLREPRLAFFFLSCALMMFAHAALYGFYSLYLDRHGYAKTWIGAIWSLGVLAEIVLFRWQRGIFERFGALPLLSASMLVAALRFALIGWAGGHWLVVLACQLMHAVTFGVHHSAAMSLLHRWFEPQEQGRAQALFVTLGYGLGGSAGGLVAGWWWTEIGPAWAFYGAAFAALLGWGAVVACQRFEYPSGSSVSA